MEILSSSEFYLMAMQCICRSLSMLADEVGITKQQEVTFVQELPISCRWMFQRM